MKRQHLMLWGAFFLALPLVLLFTNMGPSQDLSADSAQILSGYWGVDNVAIINFCPTRIGPVDGMPLVFSKPFAANTNLSDPSRLFRVVNSVGQTVQVACATLAPATGLYENQTILLVGQFADASAGQSIAYVQVTGELNFADGSSATGLVTPYVTPLASGVELVDGALYAYSEFKSGRQNSSGCPRQTTHVLKVTFEGGVRVTDPSGVTPPGAFRVTVQRKSDGATGQIEPFLLSDETDNDNHVNLCLQVDTNQYDVLSVAVEEGVYGDPMGVLNPASQVSL